MRIEQCKFDFSQNHKISGLIQHLYAIDATEQMYGSRIKQLGAVFFLPKRQISNGIISVRMKVGRKMEKVPMTAAGHVALQEELQRRQSVDRPEIIAAIAEARAHGDLSENAEYHAAKEQQSLNEGRVSELEDILSRAEIIDVTKLSGDTVKFGATVELADEDTDDESTYQIVGDQEADVKLGKISISSPIARALIGKSEGDSAEVAAPGGAKSYEILSVKFI